jgi:prepilin-type N-terminal cleavage/methylation domain-containing protein
MKRNKFQTGFTMLEVVIVIAVVAILAGMIAPLAVNTIKQSRVNACWEEVQIIKNALVGDPTLTESGSRSSFGFVGDTGVLPGDPNSGGDGLEDLLSNTILTGTVVYPNWAQDVASDIWFGWRGPYLTEARDPWGRDYNYATRAVTVDDNRMAFIWSSGMDGLTTADPLVVTAINDDNIRVSIRQDEAFSMISGNTLDVCGAGTDCTVTIYAPDGINGIVPFPQIVTTVELSIYNSGILRYVPIGIRTIIFNKLATDYQRFIIVNNGPITTVNFREPGACN